VDRTGKQYKQKSSDAVVVVVLQCYNPERFWSGSCGTPS